MVIQRLLAIEAEIHKGNKSGTITTINFSRLLTPHSSRHFVIGGHFAGFDFFSFYKIITIQ